PDQPRRASKPLPTRPSSGPAARSPTQAALLENALYVGLDHEGADIHCLGDFLIEEKAYGDKSPMNADAAERVRETTDAIYRAESRRVFATLVRLLGDFDLAEEALHDAFRAALEQWPRDGVPANPRAWLVSAGRFKAIDGIRRRARFDAIEDVAEQVEAIVDDAPLPGDNE